MRISTGLGSHLYALMRVIPKTSGDVLEMGIGIGSTPYLHWACMGKRHLVSYEQDPKYYSFLKGFASPDHELHLVESYDDADIERPWGVAFIDHGPNLRRIVDIKRIVDYARVLVLHDTAPVWESKYHYKEIYPLFKFRVDYPVAKTWVSVLSNHVDVEKKFGAFTG